MLRKVEEKQVNPRFKPDPRFGRTFMREWRKRNHKTLQQMSERLEFVYGIEISHASLSRMERGLQPYNQAVLEALAQEYGTDAASLIMRNPIDPEGIWSIWDQAKPADRPRIIEAIKGFIRTGTNG